MLDEHFSLKLGLEALTFPNMNSSISKTVLLDYNQQSRLHKLLLHFCSSTRKPRSY